MLKDRRKSSCAISIEPSAKENDVRRASYVPAGNGHPPTSVDTHLQTSNATHAIEQPRCGEKQSKSTKETPKSCKTEGKRSANSLSPSSAAAAIEMISTTGFVVDFPEKRTVGSPSSFSLGGELRRSSYDVHKPTTLMVHQKAERRSSYDVATASRDSSSSANQDYKPERRGSMVQRWFRHISEAAEAYKSKNGKHRARTADPSPVSIHDCDANHDNQQQQQHAKIKLSDDVKVDDSSIHDDSHSSTCISLNSSTEVAESPAKKLGVGSKSPSKLRKRTEPLRLTTENPLIEPSQVLISQRPVHTAQPVLTPLERLRRKDELIKETLKEKQQLVADILHVPREEYETIADLAGEPAFDKKASELVLAAVNQANLLSTAINESLQVTEEEAILATSEVHNQQSSQSKISRLPSVPVPKLQTIANTISSNLTQLLTLVMEQDEERERLRQEVQRNREQLHALHEIQQRLEQTQSFKQLHSDTDTNFTDSNPEKSVTKSNVSENVSTVVTAEVQNQWNDTHSITNQSKS